LTPIILLIGLVIGLVAGYTLISWRNRSKYLAIAEYWVYLPADKMPSQDAMMTRMISENPFAKPRSQPIGPAEGLIFSDIRLHMALVLKHKNEHLFRPDRFALAEGFSPEALQSLNNAKSLVKIRFASEEPISDRRYIQFLPYATEATMALGEGHFMYDLKQDRIYSRDQLHQELTTDNNANRADLHLRAEFLSEAESNRVVTRGLAKLGLEDFETAPLPIDFKVLSVQIVEKALEQIWQSGTIPVQMEIEAFGDTFIFNFERRRNQPLLAKIQRMSAI